MDSTAEQLSFLGVVLAASQWTVIAAFLQFFAAAVMAGATIWLVRVTRHYARSTDAIATATRMHVEASQKMVFASAQPIIVFDSLAIQNPSNPSVTGSESLLVPYEFHASFHNEGTGPGLNIVCKIDSCGFVYAGSSTRAVLGIDPTEAIHVPPSYRRPRENLMIVRTEKQDVKSETPEIKGVIEATYDDIYGNRHRSLMDFTYDPRTKGVLLQNLRLDKPVEKERVSFPMSFPGETT